MTLTIYEELEQGTPEWLQARCGLFDRIDHREADHPVNVEARNE